MNTEAQGITVAEASPSPQEPANAPEGIALADSSSAQQIEDRYVAAFNALVDDADKHKAGGILVDVLAWAIARMIMRVDSPWGAGDVMRKIGFYVCSMQDRRAAQQDAEHAKENGQLPH